MEGSKFGYQGFMKRIKVPQIHGLDLEIFPLSMSASNSIINKLHAYR
jgi:hypothetical protein